MRLALRRSTLLVTSNLAILRHLRHSISYLATFYENHMLSLAGKRRFGTVGREVLFAQDPAESRRLQRAAAPYT